MIQVDGNGTVIDNAWLWQADHDDCEGASDKCFSAHGLVVNDDSVTTYGLMVEHQQKNMVQWNGNNGHVFFYQSELPYHYPSFGSSGYVGYSVKDTVINHTGIGLGVYLIGDLQNVTGFRVPPSSELENIVIWHIAGDVQNFKSVLCTDNHTTCLRGSCEWDKCRLTSLSAQLSQEKAAMISFITWSVMWSVLTVAVVAASAYFYYVQQKRRQVCIASEYHLGELG
jgi:hypothetical protein